MINEPFSTNLPFGERGKQQVALHLDHEISDQVENRTEKTSSFRKI